MWQLAEQSAHFCKPSQFRPVTSTAGKKVDYDTLKQRNHRMAKRRGGVLLHIHSGEEASARISHLTIRRRCYKHFVLRQV